MSSRIFRIIAGVMLLIGGVYVLLYLSEVEIVTHSSAPDMLSIAETMNIRNLVSAVYLGPRVFDTILEVMVVLLTVYGIQYLRARHEQEDNPEQQS